MGPPGEGPDLLLQPHLGQKTKFSQPCVGAPPAGDISQPPTPPGNFVIHL